MDLTPDDQFGGFPTRINKQQTEKVPRYLRKDKSNTPVQKIEEPKLRAETLQSKAHRACTSYRDHPVSPMQVVVKKSPASIELSLHIDAIDKLNVASSKIS